jgi:hypothetical protein
VAIGVIVSDARLPDANFGQFGKALGWDILVYFVAIRYFYFRLVFLLP